MHRRGDEYGRPTRGRIRRLPCGGVMPRKRFNHRSTIGHGDVLRSTHLHRQRAPRFAASAGPVFQGSCHQRPCYPNTLFAPPSGFQPAVKALPKNKIWSTIERLQTFNGCHFSVACRPERPKSLTRLTFRRPATGLCANDALCGAESPTTMPSGRPAIHLTV